MILIWVEEMYEQGQHRIESLRCIEISGTRVSYSPYNVIYIINARPHETEEADQ